MITVDSHLALTPFERYMICDDRGDAYPMSIPIQWLIQGRPNRERFSEAFRQAIALHPLLNCLAQRGAWRHSASALCEVAYFHSGQHPTSADRSVSPRTGPTFRCNVIENGEHSIIEVVGHHAVIDGVSILEVCGDLFALYAIAMGALDAAKLRLPHNDYLRTRNILDREIPKPIGQSAGVSAINRETLRFFTRRAETIAGDTGYSTSVSGNSVGWCMVGEQLDQACSERMHAAAVAMGATINDWAIAALLRVLAGWNDQHRPRIGSGWLIANMPVLMRPRKAIRCSAANMIGYAFLGRQRCGLNDWKETLSSIAAESRYIQHWKTAGMFLDGLAMASHVPGGVYLSTRIARPASCIMSHVGDPLRRFRTKLPMDAEGFAIAGDITVRQLLGAAPVRPGTNVAASINSLGSRLNLSIRVVPRVFSATGAEQLCRLWKEEMVCHV